MARPDFSGGGGDKFGSSRFGGGGGSRSGGGGGGGYDRGGDRGGSDDERVSEDLRGLRAFARRKVCRYCADKTAKVDYKDIDGLKYFVTERGKIIPRRISGNCAKHQRTVAIAIKRARIIALIPYTVAAG